MTWDQRRIYASSMVTSNPAKRKRHGVILQSKRQHTFRYQFKVNGIVIPVCKMLFWGTLNMKEWSIKDWSKRQQQQTRRLQFRK